MNHNLDRLTLSKRVKTLRAEVFNAATRRGRKLLLENEQQAYAASIYEATRVDKNALAMTRHARILNHFAHNFPVQTHPHELIIGSQRFLSPDLRKYYPLEQLEGLLVGGNHGHIVVDYALLLRHGIDGMATKINRMPASVNRDAMRRALDVFAVFINRHADAYAATGRHEIAARCRRLTVAPPATFHDALQLVWFIQIFLHVECNAMAVSFGRLDQYLWPFLQSDLKRKRITVEQAFELLGCFFLKCCEGDESQNLVVGGEAPEGGVSGENFLSLLILRVTAMLQVWQPSISVRIGPYTSEEFWNEALKLCMAGIGMPSFFNEPVVTTALGRLGVPSERARDWGIVGCYEAAPQGDSYPLTVASLIILPTLLQRFINAAGDEIYSFDEFYRNFKAFVLNVYEQEYLPDFQNSWNTMRQHHASPFESLCVSGCIDSGRAVEEGGAAFNFFGVNILGIGTLIDSLLVIKTLVYTEKALTLTALTEQLRRNFPDEAILQRCRHLPSKFGSDTPEINHLAHDLSTFFATMVIDRPLADGVRPYPGLFRFGSDIHLQLPATPDGRRDHDFISYGCGPGIFLPPGRPTSILNSVAALAHDHCACGNPLMLSLSRDGLGSASDRMALRHLIAGYFLQGGFHLHVNLAGAEELRQARRHPEHYRELIIRISGFSAAFVTLDERWQNAIIERTEKGM